MDERSSTTSSREASSGTLSQRRHTCRICEAPNLVPVLDLGRMPLANRLLTPAALEQPEPQFPLELVFCPNCTLVQITETVDPSTLFAHYLYFSSFSDSLLAHAKKLADHLVRQEQLGSQHLVVEIASNDGYLLQYFQQAGIPVLGVEPASNIAEVARQRGIETVNRFFDAHLAQQLVDAGRRADVLVANNVLAHVAALHEFVAGVQRLLAPAGIAVFEVPYVRDMVDHCEFDTIYHEHLCYYSLTALDHLFRKHDLIVADVQHVSIHGGSLRVSVRHAEARPSSRVRQFLEEEHRSGLTGLDYYRDFAKQVENLRERLLAKLVQLKKQGYRLAGYGAAAKGTVLLNYFGIDRQLLDYVVDRSTVKQGHYVPGVHLPIVSPQQLADQRPDFLLVLAWNFADEIIAQQAEYRRSGGRFLIPIPQLKVA